MNTNINGGIWLDKLLVYYLINSMFVSVEGLLVDSCPPEISSCY